MSAASISARPARRIAAGTRISFLLDPRRRLLLPIACVAMLGVGCLEQVVTPIPTGKEASPDSPVVESPSTHLPALNVAQARATATVLAFIDAFNAGSPDRAVALLIDDVVISDCDYRTRRPVSARGRREALEWLHARAADGDAVQIARLSFGTPNQVGGFAVAVEFERRVSGTLRALGFSEGIVPGLATKVAVSKDGREIVAINAGC